MKVSIVIRPFLFLMIASCEVIAPNTSSSGDAQVSLLRNINIKCEATTLADCTKDGFGDGKLKVYGHYTKELCVEIDHNTISFAKSFGELHCSSQSCNALIKGFKQYLESAQYTFYSFIDINDNEALDSDEPYFCSDGVHIIPAKRLINLEVSFVRNYGD